MAAGTGPSLAEIRGPLRAVGTPAAAKPLTICQTIDRNAAIYGLPIEFFARLIWRESRLQPNAISPVGAQGIAQFMPGTAAIRKLANAFDPAQALPASAFYLSDLTVKFGNLGLAAAAYNAGEQRVTDWLAGTTRLPLETIDYVAFITGRAAEDWRTEEDAGALAVPRPGGCSEIVAALARPGAGSTPILPGAGGTAKWSPWGVQMAGNFSEAKARATYASLQRQYAPIIGARDPIVVRSVMRSRGAAPFFEVRVPAQSRGEADALCARLRAAGGACVVMKN